MQSKRANNLAWTGERLTTGMTSDIIIHHLHRYALAIQVSKGKIVLDIASGEGYGSNLMADSAEKVIGVDISSESISFARNKYRKTNLEFREGSAAAIPVGDHEIDVVISFETIEHHDQHEQMLSEFKRILKPGGLVLISSPDKLNYTDIPKYNNPFHVKELYADEFRNLMSGHFKHIKLYNQNMLYGSVITPADFTPSGYSQFSGDFTGISETKTPVSVYNLCFASDKELPDGLFSETSFFNADQILSYLMNLQNEIHNSKTYKAGLFVTFPFRIFRILKRKSTK